MASPISRVTVVAPARIHLGLLSIGERAGRRFGGAGVMLSEPAVRLSVTRSDSDAIHGIFPERAQHFIEVWRDHTGIRDRVQCEVLDAPPQHTGLGVGTQLGMSVAMALDTLVGREVSVQERARSVGRGLRSAVGAHGFHVGGMIVESGKTENEELGQLTTQLNLPETWRVVLVQPSQQRGLAGADEVQAFSQLSGTGESTPPPDLHSLLNGKLIPAAKSADFEAFSEAVYQYGFASGGMFATAQGGAFLNQEVASFVDWCRERGTRGVGQSSWGPTVFCWLPSESAANQFVNEIQTHLNLTAAPIVSSVARSGARVEHDGNLG